MRVILDPTGDFMGDPQRNSEPTDTPSNVIRVVTNAGAFDLRVDDDGSVQMRAVEHRLSIDPMSANEVRMRIRYLGE